MEYGTIVAKEKSEATAKLNQSGFSEVRLKQVCGLAALWKRFTAELEEPTVESLFQAEYVLLT